MLKRERSDIVSDMPNGLDGSPFSGEGFNELRFARSQHFFDRSILIRCFLGFFLALCLFFFIQGRHTYVESFVLGSPATQPLFSPISFFFPDHTATAERRREAVFEIGTIFRLSPQEIKERVTEIQKYLTQNPTGIAEWDQRATEGEDLSLSLSIFSEKLSSIRFTDGRTLQRLERFHKDELPLQMKYFFNFQPSFLGDKEQLPPPILESFRIRFFQGSIIPDSVSSFLISYITPMAWHLQEDPELESHLRALAQRAIQEQWMEVQEGERILRKGEVVTPHHVELLQALVNRLHEVRATQGWSANTGVGLLVLLFIWVGALYLYQNHRAIFFSNRKLALIVTIILLSIGLGKGVEWFLYTHATHSVHFLEFPLLVPFGAILLTHLLHFRIAALATLLLSILFMIALPVDPTPFLLMNIVASIVAIVEGQKIRLRKEVFLVCAKACGVTLLVILAWDLYQHLISPNELFWDGLSAIFFMALTAIAVVGLLPLFESLFRIMTDITLMEFLDPSHELLRRLTLEAPGTYQHSMIVGNLAEAAATAIGANGLFCRVATQYHDVGKLANPHYFTENQWGNIDMHQLLTPQESAQVIIAHVSEGVALSRKVGLPEPFIDIIKEHHGTSLAYYFYHKQISLVQGKMEQVCEGDFRYAGPTPRTKESTIIMIADTLEAASRSLDVFDETHVRELMLQLIVQKLRDGQFRDSLLTFEELHVVQEVLIKTLLAASHPRVKYPNQIPGEDG